MLSIPSSQNKIFALVDCNSFYVSCEKVFNPSIRNHPTIVLSNNDGCVISRSNEVKRLGIAVGAPIFKYQDLVKKHSIKVFSANFVLYGDMSNRVMAVLSNFTPNMEIYSIDEAFLSLEGFEHYNLEEYGRKVRGEIKKQTGIPVSIGIAQTKSLAKVANHFAKDHPETNGVFCLLDEKTIDHYLEQTPVRDIWGIGGRKAEFLNRNGIDNALQLKNADDEWIKKYLTVATLRTVWELRGISCLDLEEIQPDKKAIGTSRTFGYEVKDFVELEEAVSSYIANAAEKLRSQESMAGYVQVYVETNQFNDKPYYRSCAGAVVSPPTAYTPRLIETAKTILKKIYREGLNYKRCGVILMNICPQTSGQEYLFEEKYEGSPHQRLMEIMDRYNRQTNEAKIFIASEGLGRSWYMKQAHKSKRFTTRWDELLEIKI